MEHAVLCDTLSPPSLPAWAVVATAASSQEQAVSIASDTGKTTNRPC